MPRNSGTGVYSPPPNITAAPGAPIESADWNALVQDLTGTFNQPVPVSFLPSLTALGGMPIAGGTFTGPVFMYGDATASLHPVTKQQFDTAIAATAPSGHTHIASQVTDFSTAVDARIGVSSINALADVSSSSPSIGDAVVWDGANYVNTPISSTLVATATTSGSSVDIAVPSWAKSIVLEFDMVATNGSGGASSTDLVVRIGGGSTVETTGYASISEVNGIGVVASTTHFNVKGNMFSASAVVGSMTIIKTVANRWQSSSSAFRADAGTVTTQAGVKTTASALGIIRITTPGGANVFTGGSVIAIFSR